MTSPELPPVDISLDLAGQQRRIRLDHLTSEHTVRDLLALLPELRGHQSDVVDIDGRLIPCSTPVVGALKQGSTLAPTRPEIAGRQAASAAPAGRAVWTTGPDAGRFVECREGRHTVGSARDAALTCADDSVARHQGVVVVHADGRACYEDLGIGRPSMVDGQLVSGRVDLAPGSALEIGASTLVFRGSIDQSAASRTERPTPRTWMEHGIRQSAASPWTEPCVRVTPTPVGAEHEIPVPALEPAAGSSGVSTVGLVTAGVSLAGGGLLAALLRQPLMVLMVAIGAVGAIVTFAVQTVGSRRSSRRQAAHRQAVQTEFGRTVALAHMTATLRAAAAPQLADLVTFAADGSIWSSPSPTVCLGVGDVPWAPKLSSIEGHTPTAEVAAAFAAPLDDHALLRSVPVTFDFVSGQVVAIVGHQSNRNALVRSMLTQLAVQQGPSQWRLTVVAGDDVGRWTTWASWLPHATAGVEGESLIVGSFDGATRQRLSESADDPVDGQRAVLDVLVVVNGSDLVHRTSELRRFLAGTGDHCALVVLGDRPEMLPITYSDLIEVGRTESTWSRRGGTVPAVRFRLAGASVDLAAEVARSLARWTDPEMLDSDRGIPARVDAIGLFGQRAASAGDIAAGWSLAGMDPSPTALIGLAADGAVELDLDRDGPHVLVAGTTGAGKSELLRTLIMGLAISASPEHLQLLLVDYKGGSAFDACAAMPHVAGVVTDLDDRLAERVLRSLNAELARRERLLRHAGAENLRGFRRGGGLLARLVIVVDEFASLAAELVDFIPSIVDIARRGRSLGVHLVLATQRPAGVVNDDIRANTNLRIGLRLQDTADSNDVVGTGDAARLPRHRPGRAVIRFGADELVEVQVARCTGPSDSQSVGRRPQARAIDQSLAMRAGQTMKVTDANGHTDTSSAAPDSTLALLVERVRRATKLAHSDIPSRPWLPALPASLSAVHVKPDAMGLVDDPDSQMQQPLTWTPEHGHLVVVGTLGSGTSGALLAIATGVAAGLSPRQVHLYLVDQASSLAALDRLGHCGARVSVFDGDGFSRLLDLLATEVDRRQRAVVGGVGADADIDPSAAIVVLIDGGAALRQFLGDHDNVEDAERFDRIASVGPQVGVVMVIAADQPAAIPTSVLSRSGDRWVLSLHDPFEAALVGVEPRKAIVAGPAGRGVASSSGSEFQLVTPHDVASRVDSIVAAHGSTPIDGRGPRRLGTLPTVVLAADLARPHGRVATSITSEDNHPAGLQLLVGLDVRQLSPRGLSLCAGDHALIAGPARSGRTNLLALIVNQCSQQRPTGWIGVVPARRAGALGATSADCTGPLDDVLDALPRNLEILLVIDDADSVEDTTGRLATLLNSSTIDGQPVSVQVVAAGRVDGLRSNYGHWTTIVRRQRRGVLLGSAHDLDADLFSAMLPRRTAGASVPGRGWLIQHGVVEAVQIGLLEDVAA